MRKVHKRELDVQDELLEIGVDEEEIEELVVGDDHFEVNKNDGLEEESEQLDYNDDLPQTDDVHVEYDSKWGANNTKIGGSQWNTHTHTHNDTPTHIRSHTLTCTHKPTHTSDGMPVTKPLLMIKYDIGNGAAKSQS